MDKSLVKLILILIFSLIAGYYFLHYLDLRSNIVFESFDLQGRNSFNNKYRDYKWKSDNIFVFLQLSDIHLSIFHDVTRVSSLRKFLSHELELIRPELVVVSGDLTDARMPNHKASRQYELEWKMYHDLLQQFRVDEKTKWLDLRGNHDAFNVFSLEDKENFFPKYSKRGPESQRSYMYTVRKPFGQYSFIMIDAVPLPGPKRPYNFFGLLDRAAFLDVQEFVSKSRASNQSFWFGHYPLSIIMHNGFDLYAVLGQHAYSYMCGHLHTLSGLVPHMYGLHPEGFLELELGDWMASRLYRLVAVDNDVVSFTDFHLGTWPAVHVTNPKDARFLLPHKEPVSRVNVSHEVRILAYSPDPIVFVKVWIDGGYCGNAAPLRVVSGLFALPWKPASYARAGDMHQLEVRVRGASGRESYVRQEFSCSGQPAWQFGMLPGLILLGDMTRFLQLLFYSTWLLLFAPLIAMRVFKYRLDDCGVHSQCTWLRGVYKFELIDALFYPWTAYFLYMACGPLMFGYFIDNQFGVMLINGMYIGGRWLPESSIYASEVLQLWVFHLPLLILLTRRLNRCLTGTPQPYFPVGGHNIARNVFLWARDCRSWIYPLLMWQLWLAIYSLFLTYDLSVFLFSPCRLWQVGFGWYLHRVVCRSEDSMSAHNRDN